MTTTTDIATLLMMAILILIVGMIIGAKLAMRASNTDNHQPWRRGP